MSSQQASALWVNSQVLGSRVETAVLDVLGEHEYSRLFNRSTALAHHILDGAEDLAEDPVVFLASPGAPYVSALWAIWQAGGMAVPLSPLHPMPELDYVVEHAGAKIILCSPDFTDQARELSDRHRLRIHQLELGSGSGPRNSTPRERLPTVGLGRRALMLYTSGTTGRPKGAVLTHAAIEAQIKSLVAAWEISPADVVLHALPLHHIHGIVNALLCPLWVGAGCRMLSRFSAEEIWREFDNGNATVFMGVPTMYSRLVAAWAHQPVKVQRRWSQAAGRLRLMISGSAALPESLLAEWKRVSGHVLLERYGMTEIGMGLSNPLRGIRRPGHVGSPLPGVKVRLVDDAGHEVAAGVPGEIHVRGPNLFTEYWRDPVSTANAFANGWFRTGDTAVLDGDDYRILGRTSVDIIKSGGYKVSALEIEAVMLEHPLVEECAVVGLPDDEWGERVCAAVVMNPGVLPTGASLRAWAKERMAHYKVPRDFLPTAQLPRNAMGKVTKGEVKELIDAASPDKFL